MMIEPRRNSRHFGRFLLQFRLHWFWHYHPALCCLWDTTTGGKVIRVHQVFLVLLLSLFPPCSEIWFIVSQFSHLFRWLLHLTSPSPSIATSSKNSISFGKWKLHHLRRVSIKLEGGRNGNVKIEILGAGKCEMQEEKLVSKMFECWWEVLVGEEILVWWARSRGRGVLWPLIENFPDHCYWLPLTTCPSIPSPLPH